MVKVVTDVFFSILMFSSSSYIFEVNVYIYA